MPRDLILGTAGHIDHGKTSLVKALTGVDCDRLPEEKARGITIDIGFAHLDLGGVRLGIVDVPGHERFIKNMLAGATGIDLALLVVAADDSVMPRPASTSKSSNCSASAAGWSPSRRPTWSTKRRAKSCRSRSANW
jgi:small GTP-binding protein